MKPRVGLSHQPNEHRTTISYTPSQATVAYPERVGTRNPAQGARGVSELAPDTQSCSDDGIVLGPESVGFELQFRRGSIDCRHGAVLVLGCENYPVGEVSFGYLEGEEFVALHDCEERRMLVRPNRVVYDFATHNGSSMTVEVLIPSSLPAYGVLARIRSDGDLTPAARVESLQASPRKMFAPHPRPSVQTKVAREFDSSTGLLIVESPQHPDHPLGEGYPKQPRLFHDTRYKMLSRFAADASESDGYVIAPASPATDNEYYFSTIISSPGYDSAATRGHLKAYFTKNDRLSGEILDRLVDEAETTFAGIVCGGAEADAALTRDPAGVFHACLESADAGIHRGTPVTIQTPDERLTAHANLLANDLFQGIVQPPGLVHNAKGGKGRMWDYIFCYRHVHAASDIGYERWAGDYLRLLSANQNADGWIRSVKIDFEGSGHPTSFDASYIDAAMHYFHWTGDSRLLEDLWPTLQRAAEYIDASLDPDGDNLYKDLIHQWKSDFDNRGPSSSYQTAIVRRAYADLAEIARVLGETEAETKYAGKALAIMEAAQRELWSDETAMLGPKGPLGMLRLHPQSLEVEIPVWTGLVDRYQAVMLTEWYLTNMAMRDDAGGLWFYDNDWWPLVWSQHTPSPGDAIMVGWALLQAGRFNEGTDVLATIAHASFRSLRPGISYSFTEDGTINNQNDHWDVGTGLGAYFRHVVEGLFGVAPRIDEGRLTITPRLPYSWDHAEFERPGLRMVWTRDDNHVSLQVDVQDEVVPTVGIPVRAGVTAVAIDGRPAEYRVEPGMRHAWIMVELPRGGGRVEVKAERESAAVLSSTIRAEVGDAVRFSIDGGVVTEWEDRWGFLTEVSSSDRSLEARVAKSGCGLAGVYAHVACGNVRWIEPLFTRTTPATAKDAFPPTQPLVSSNATFTALDISSAFTDDIQQCFLHELEWDAGFKWASMEGLMRYWTMPYFRLTERLPGSVTVGSVPFELGSMEVDGRPQKNLVMLCNTPPRELPTTMVLEIAPTRTRSIHILSLNMNLPMKSYVPAVLVVMHYTNGTVGEHELTPPVDFDSYYQDFAVRTNSLRLETEPAYLEYFENRSWPSPERQKLAWGQCEGEYHLTHCSVPCDDAHDLERIELKSIATETFFGVAAITLEVP